MCDNKNWRISFQKGNFSMSTTTSSPNKTQAEEGPVASTAGHSLQGWLLIFLVFIAGSASLAVELSASRLLAPYFGTWWKICGPLSASTGSLWPDDCSSVSCGRYSFPLASHSELVAECVCYLLGQCFLWLARLGYTALCHPNDSAWLRLTFRYSLTHSAGGQIRTYSRATLCHLHGWQHSGDLLARPLAHSDHRHLPYLLCFCGRPAADLDYRIRSLTSRFWNASLTITTAADG